MIQLGELTQIAERDGVEARTVERDYVLNQILVHLYGDEDPRADDLVFKGGTLLRACYFDEYRYSADLDFSLRGSLSAPDAEAFVGDALVRCSEAAGFDRLDMERVSGRECRVTFQRPYGREGRIKLNVADDELLGEPARLGLISRYSDIPTLGSVTGYTLEEVGAEKLRCVIQRVQARDYYDLYRLFVVEGERLDASWGSFIDKARHKNLDPERFGEKLDERRPLYEARWIGELSGYMRDVPPFDRVDREVRGVLRTTTDR